MTARTTTSTAALATIVVATLAALGAATPADAITPTPAPTVSSTATAAPTTSPTASPAATATPTPVVKATPKATVIPRPTATATAVPTAIPVPTPTPTPTPVVPLPVATSINKLVGHAANSRTVTMTGSRFTNLAGVQFAGVPVANLVVQSDTRARFVLQNSLDYQPKIAAVTLTARSDLTPRPTGLTYQYKVTNRLDRQMAYAFKNWNAYSNKTFGYLSGSDCANFASQTLLARGWKRSSQWFNYGSGDWSGTWVSSTALSSWLKKRPDLAKHLTYSQRDEAKVGDIVQFRWPGHSKKYTSWDHTGIVSKVVVLPNGRHDVYYVAHTLNRQYGGGTTGLASYYASRKIKGSTLRIQFFHLEK
jgi:hypothetical protein